MFYLIFDQINAALVSIRNFKIILTILPIQNIWMVEFLL